MRQPQFKSVVITGGIASGKSTLARIFSSFSVPIIDSDKIVHSLLKKGSRVHSSVVRAFGKEYCKANGAINRKKLGNYVFNNPAKRKKLEKLIHPAVYREINRKLKSHKNRDTQIVAVEIPLLFETRQQSKFDIICLAFVSQTVQIERLMKRDSISRKSALARINAQIKLSVKRGKSDKVFDMRKKIKVLRREVEAFIISTLGSDTGIAKTTRPKVRKK